MRRELLSASLLAACAVSSMAAEPPVISVAWDWKFADGVSAMSPGDGDTLAYDGYRTIKVDAGYTSDNYYTHGRWIADFEKRTTTLIEPPLKDCPAVRYQDGAWSIVDDKGRVRYASKYKHYERDRSCTRVVTLENDRVVVIDLATLRKEELGKAIFVEGITGKAWARGNDRVITYKTFGKDLREGYDYEYGVRCEGSYGGQCRPPASAEAPGYDSLYRPAPALRFAFEGDSRKFKLYGARGEVLHKGELEKGYSSVYSWTPDGKWFAYGDDSNTVQLVDLATGKSKKVAQCSSKTSCTAKFSTGGKWLFAADKVLEMPDLKDASGANIPSADTSFDDRWSVAATNGKIGLRDLERGTTVADFVGGRYVSDRLFSPTARSVVVKIYEEGRYQAALYGIPEGRRLAAVPPEFNLSSARFSPDERYLLLHAGQYDTWSLVDTRYDASAVLKFPQSQFELAFSKSGRWIASKDGFAWRVRRGGIQRAVVSALATRLKEIEESLAKSRAKDLGEADAGLQKKVAGRRSPKGEFESGGEYAQRLKAADEQDSLDRAETDGEKKRIAAVWDAKERREAGKAREDLEAALDEEIVEPAAVTVGAYDADAEEFDAAVTVDGATRTVRLSVPRKDAPAAKGRTMTAEAAFRHGLEGGKPAREDLRLVVTDKELGQVYSWSSGAGTARRTRTAPAAPARLEVKAEFADADGDGRLAAGEAAKLAVTVTNAGAGASYGASVALAPAAADGLSYAARHFVGEIPPEASRTVVVPLKALDGARDGMREVTVTAADANGFESGALKIVFETRARRGARLSVAGIKVNDSGGDGVVAPGELAEVAVTVRNDGEGTAKAAALTLAGANADAFVQGETRKALGVLAPGQTAIARFTVFSNTSAAGTLRLRAALADGADGWDAPVEIPLGRALGASRELIVKGKDLPAASTAAAPEAPTARGEARPDAYAVVLGVEDYPKATRVSHARRDAAAFRAFATGVLGVPDDPAHLFYLDEGVTLAELRKAFSPNGWLARRAGPQSEIFVFYAGHGAPSLDGKSAFLVPQDGDPNYAVETGFPIDDMLKALDGSKARAATVWLDACFSGADRESRPLLADARPLSVTVAPVVPPGRVSLYSAASGSQVSSALPAKKHGLFTWYALKGLDGAADADKDGTLTAGELADFLGAQVPRAAGALDREQTPGFRGDRSRPLARYIKGR